MLELKKLTLRQKIGLVLCSRRTHLPEDLNTTLEMIRDHAVGCVQVRLDEKTAPLIRTMKQAADYPILFINDMERGYPTNGLPLIPALTLAACDNPDYLRDFATAIVASAKADGISGTWGPVLDIQSTNAPCSVGRSFGGTAEEVIRNAGIIAEVFRENRFIAGCKHYPGESGIPADTHMVEGKSLLTKEELLAENLRPYLELQRRGLVTGIMTAHTIYSEVDPDYPASLSPKVIGLIREAGYDGLIYTDSLAMMGILQKFGEGHAMGLALAAGNDIVLPNYRTPHKDCVEMMEEEYRKGTFTEERLNDACRHILAAMEFISEPPEKTAVLTEKVRESYRSIARDAVTAVTDEGVAAVLPDPEKRRLFVVVTGQEFDGSALKDEVELDGWYDPRRVAERIRQDFPGAEIEFLREFPTRFENERVLNRATGFEEAVVVSYCATAPYLGTDCLTRRMEAVINALVDSGKVSALVHFGNPFAVETVHHVSRILFGYSAPESQNWTIDALAGRIPARGRMPLKLHLA